MSDSNVLEEQGEAGFTLIELMIVVTIIGILAAVAIPRYITYMRSSQTAEVGNIGGLMVSAMQSYADAQSLTPAAAVTAFNNTGLAPAGATAPTNPLSNVLPQLALPGNAGFSYAVSAIAATAGPQNGDVAYCILATPVGGGVAPVMYSSSPVSTATGATASANGWTGRVFNKSYVNGAASLTGVAGGYCSATGAAQATYS